MSLQGWVSRLAGRRVLVVGDVLLDEYVSGRPTRMSREAPVPVLEFESRRHIPGGAANPAVTIARLGSQALLAGVTGDDDAGQQLRESLQAQDIDCAALIREAGRATTLKLRIMAQMGLRYPQQLARIDTLSRAALSEKSRRRLLARVKALADAADALLVSDYCIGLLTPDLVDGLRAAGASLLAVDAQGELDKYHDFGLVKCNAEEAAGWLGRSLATDEDFASAARDLGRRLRVTGAVVITRGPQGATLATATGAVEHCPAPVISDVFDVTGAGDTAIAVMTLARAAGADWPTAVSLANVASGLVVRRVGNYAPAPEELERALAGVEG
ncbi:MAG: bifunctional ADP-heptose synthase [Anaerolineaceae bacterium]|nr:bifunctional ADP-heptose synthase [Anaerolineaceae bacterium]